PRPSTLRPAPTPTTPWAATSTEHRPNDTDSETGWSRYRGLATSTEITNGVVFDDITRQPKIRREYTSTQNAV
ncbi:hypothetical protein, partial [Nocardia puris]|uniref:hypothetical protein n=1 Tax=Nocardia puris TaxID=208602 RepID=UPI001E4EA870